MALTSAPVRTNQRRFYQVSQLQHSCWHVVQGHVSDTNLSAPSYAAVSNQSTRTRFDLNLASVQEGRCRCLLELGVAIKQAIGHITVTLKPIRFCSR
jgi:hypothetical protein